MAFETGTETIACLSCGAQHLAKWSRMPVRERVTIRCNACGGIVHQANTVRDYFDVSLIDGGLLA